MENEKNFVHDLREMVNSRHEEPVVEGTACVVLAKEGSEVTSVVRGKGAHIAALLMNFAISEDEHVQAFLPLVCALFMLNPLNAVRVRSLLKDGGKGLLEAVDAVEKEGKKESSGDE